MLDRETTEEGRPRGRYHAEYVRVGEEADPQAQLQDTLADAEAKEWHLVGAAGGLPDGGVVLFWDTRRPSFGRTDSA